jgi:hypothetical protein
MKKLIILSISMIVSATLMAQTGKTSRNRPDTSSITVYTCTMHPEVIAEKPGSCPKCGMELVPKKVHKIYTCTMDTDVISDKPGKCPKCGMELVEKKPATKTKANQ